MKEHLGHFTHVCNQVCTRKAAAKSGFDDTRVCKHPPIAFTLCIPSTTVVCDMAFHGLSKVTQAPVADKEEGNNPWLPVPG